MSIEFKKEDWDRLMANGKAKSNDLRLDLLKCLYSIFEEIQKMDGISFDYSESRINYDIQTGQRGEIMTEIIFEHPTYGKVKIIGKDLLNTEKKV